MCWSGEASTVLAATGVAGAAYSALKKDPDPIALWATLLYFSGMEALQAVSYTVINQCDSPLNQMMTLLGYLHICFQPFFINAAALYFMPKESAKVAAPWLYAISFFGALSMLFQLYPFEWAGHCAIGSRPLCGDVLCTVRGKWHIAWLVPTNGIGNSAAGNFFLSYGFHGYGIAAFIAPLLAGSWRLVFFTWLFGPVLTIQTTDNINEWPAIWCLFSIFLCLSIIKTPLRKYLHVGDPWWVIYRNHRKERLMAERLNS